MKTRILKKIRERSGASLLIVMGLMLFLVAIGGAALAAAGATIGAGDNKYDLNQLRLYTDSMHKTMMAAFAENSDDQDKDLLSATDLTMGGYLLHAMYTYRDMADGFAVDVEPKLLAIPTASDVYDIQIFIEPLVRVHPFEQYEREIVDDLGEVVSTETVIIPERVYLSAEVTMTISVDDGEKSEQSTVKYQYTGGFLEGNEVDPATELTVMKPGAWRFAAYE